MVGVESGLVEGDTMGSGSIGGHTGDGGKSCLRAHGGGGAVGGVVAATDLV